MANEYQTVEQVAERMAFHPESIRRLCRAGHIPGAIKLGGKDGSWRIPATWPQLDQKEDR